MLKQIFFFKIFETRLSKIEQSEGRRRYEKFISQFSINGNILIVGFQEYNLHHLLYYQFFGDVTLVDPNPPVYLYKFVNLKQGRLRDVKFEVKFNYVELVGVYGYGLDDLVDLQLTIEYIVDCLEINGILILAIDLNHDPLNLLENIDLISNELTIVNYISFKSGYLIQFKK